MHEYLIEREYDRYLVYKNDKPILHARLRDPALPLVPFLRETINFYDDTGTEIITSKLYLFFGVGLFRKVKFKNGDSFKTKHKIRKSYVLHNGYEYRIKHLSKKKGDELYVNNILVGHLYRKVEGVSSYSHSIVCDEEKYCFIFSVINILFYKFDVN